MRAMVTFSVMQAKTKKLQYIAAMSRRVAHSFGTVTQCRLYLPRGPGHSEPNMAPRWKIFTIFLLQLTFARVKAAFIALFVAVGLVRKELTYLTTVNIKSGMFH